MIQKRYRQQTLPTAKVSELLSYCYLAADHSTFRIPADAWLLSGLASAPRSPKTIPGYEVWHPLGDHELAVDISETLETKTEALSRHRSQTATVRYDEAVRGLARWRGIMSLSGGDPEVFEVI